MDSLPLSTRTSGNCFPAIQFISYPFHNHGSKPRIISFTSRKPGKSLVFASKGGPELDEWDKMELKFGRMIGEDPKITMAKIMGRKSNPELSYLEIEKLLEQKKGKEANDDVEELVFDASEERKSTSPLEGLNLVRPVPKGGTKFEENVKPVNANNKSRVKPIMKPTEERKSSVPNVILRKPSSFVEEDGANGISSRFGMKPNLSLQMGKEQQKKRFSDMTLLRKPEQIIHSDESGHPDSDDGNAVMDDVGEKSAYDADLLQKPELLTRNLNEGAQESLKEYTESSFSNVVNQSQEAKEADPQLDMGSTTDLQAETGTSFTSDEVSGNGDALQAETGTSFTSDAVSGNSNVMSTDMILKGRPKRLDLSSEASNQKREEEPISMTPESFENPLEIEKSSTLPYTEGEDHHWDRAEKLLKTGEREEVELISSTARGFAVSFNSLTGFLPYRNLPAKWKFLAFESWLRRKGLDPGNYRQNLGVVGKYDANSLKDSSESGLSSDINNKPNMALLPDMKLEDLLMVYDQEKLTYLTSFVGQRVNVGIVLADRKSRRLIVTLKPREKEELVEKKKRLMSQLSVGDVIKCCITKITYFGVFVEVEGVPALIHQTEVSWDATLDPESSFKVGQIVEAKVHQLDFSLQRIFLSLKEITPDPLSGALDAVVGDRDPLDGEFVAAEADTEWPDVESLIKELQQYEGIQSVSKGRYFLSPGLAPTFQVYMASMFENQYKLLARAGNKVQEVIVQTSLGKDEVKSAIMTCTNRVE